MEDAEGRQEWVMQDSTAARTVSEFTILFLGCGNHPSTGIPYLENCSLVIIFDIAAAAKLLQSCPTLCNPVDSSPPHSPISGIFQTKTLEWVAISFSNA